MNKQANSQNLSQADDKIMKAIKTKLNRVSNLENDDRQEVAQKLLENFTDKELLSVMNIVSPLAGLKKNTFRGYFQIYIASLTGKNSFQMAMRALVVDAINIYRLSTSTKKLFIDGVVNGNIGDDKRKIPKSIKTAEEKEEFLKYAPGSYYQAWVLARERVYENSKVNVPNIKEYDALLKYFKSSTQENAFTAIENDPNLSNNSKEYIRSVEKYALGHMSILNDLINAQVFTSHNFTTAVSMFKNWSKYYSEHDKHNKHSYKYYTSMAILDMAIYMEGDLSGLADLLEEYISNQIS